MAMNSLTVIMLAATVIMAAATKDHDQPPDREGIERSIWKLARSDDAIEPSLHERVVGGQTATEKDMTTRFPFLVSMWLMKDNPFYPKKGLYHVCGAVILDDKWILTAAQCFKNNIAPSVANAANWQIKVGIYDQTKPSPGEQTLTIQSYFLYPQYNGAKTVGDFALAKLKERISMTKVAKAELSEHVNCPQPGDVCTVVGWGQIAEKPDGVYNNLPMFVDVPVVKQSDCKKAYTAYSQYFGMDHTTLCAGYLGQGGKDACAGDAGSPLICTCGPKKVVAGLVSSGVGCARKQYPGVYSKVSSVIGWIRKTMQDNDKKS